MAEMSFNEMAEQADLLVQQAIKTLTTDIKAPTYSKVDTTVANRELDRARKSRDQSSETIDRETTRANEANTEIKEGIDAEAKGKVALINAEQEKAQIEADNNAYYNNLFFSADIATKAATQKDAIRKADIMRANIQQMQSVGPGDDVLEWLGNTFQLPSRINEYNAQANQVNSLQEQIDQGIQTAQAAAAQTNRAVPTITKGIAKAKADIEVGTALKAKGVADDNLARVNVDFATKRLSGDLAIASATENMTRLDIEQSRLKFEADLKAVQLAESRAERQMKAAALMDKLGMDQALDVILKNYDIQTGKPPNTTTRFSLKNETKASQENIIAIGSGSGGHDLWEFYRNFTAARMGPNVPQGTLDLYDWVQQKAKHIAKADVMLKITDPKLKDEKLGEALQEAMKIEYAEASTNPKNLFHERTPAEVLANNGIPVGSGLAAALEPLTKQSGPIPSEVVIDTIAANYKNPNEAGAAVAAYYRANMELRNKTLPLALANQKAGDGYKIHQRSGIFSNPEYDVTSPAEATKYILSRRMREMNKSQEVPIY